MSRFVGLVLLLGLGLTFVAVGLVDLVGQRRYQESGETVRGTILTIESRRRDNPKSTKVTYTFTTRDGRLLHGSDLVNPQTRSRLREGGPVDIQYLASAPTSNQIREDGEEGLYALWIGIGLAFTAVTLVPWIVSSKADGTKPAYATTPT